MKRVIYPARRAVEHAVTIPGVRPLRLFPVLWPLWQVDISAHVYDEQAYEVIDHFAVRSIAEAGVSTGAELARFLALPGPVLQRCLAFLTLIGHLHTTADQITLTDLGHRSLQAGIRYEPKESRQTLLVERYTGEPMPRAYYDGAVAVLATPEVPADQVVDGSRFLSLFAGSPFRPESVTQLADHPDRARYNLHSQLRDLQVLSCRDGYLPAYLVETASHGLLAYTTAAEDRDSVLERACQQVAAVGDLINAEGMGDARAIWTEWLASNGGPPGLLHELPTGVWRAIFPSSAFGDSPKWSVTSVGSFRFRKHHFVQIWCDDGQLRHRSLLERALGIARLSEIRTLAELHRRVAHVAHVLEVAPPTVAQLRDHASRTGAVDRLARLDALATSP